MRCALSLVAISALVFGGTGCRGEAAPIDPDTYVAPDTIWPDTQPPVDTKPVEQDSRPPSDSGIDAVGDATDGPTPIAFPGSGPFQAQSCYVAPNGKLRESYWRGGEGWARHVPLLSDKTPDWANAEQWVGPSPVTNLPGSGEGQAQSMSLSPSGKLRQTYWRGGEGWARYLPFLADGTPDWGQADPWNGPAPVTNLPGAGEVQGQSQSMSPSGKLRQTYWRGGQGWARYVPMLADGTPDWGQADPWNGPAPLSNLPGTGDVDAQAQCTLSPTKLLQTYWQGGQYWRRVVPLDAAGEPDWNAADPWTGPVDP